MNEGYMTGNDHSEHCLTVEQEEMIESAVHKTLSNLGFDPYDAKEAQKDFIYLRDLRKGSEELRKAVKKAIIGVTIPSFLYLLWEALKHAVVR